MARRSLLLAVTMRDQNAADRSCSYVVLIDDATTAAGDLQDLAHYLSAVGVARCEVVILDASSPAQFDLNARMLRWVGRHLPAGTEFRTPGGEVDVVRAAAAVAGHERVIVAAADTRYTAESLVRMWELIDRYEVVEPQDYLDPLPWWGSVDAARILVHRGIEPQPDHGATFGFRRSVIRSMRVLGSSDAHDDQVRRLAAVGADVHPAHDIFVRREPGPLSSWLAERPRLAGGDFGMPWKSAFFFALGPLLLILASLGGLRLAAGYAGVIALSSVGLALRGRSGAASFFPLRACLFAPLWVFERAISVYWALFRKIAGTATQAAKVADPERVRRPKVASGE